MQDLVIIDEADEPGDEVQESGDEGSGSGANPESAPGSSTVEKAREPVDFSGNCPVAIKAALNRKTTIELEVAWLI